MEIFPEDHTLFVEVLLPLAISHTYTYSVPPEMAPFIQPGIRVEVQFGQRRHYAGLICKVKSTPPEGYRVKPLLDILDEQPVVTPAQLQFWEWMAGYYMCTMGEVMQAALPAQLKLESATVFSFDPNCDIDILALPDDEYLVASALQQQPALSLEDLQQILQKRHVVKIVKNLLEAGVMLVSEVMAGSYKPKKAAFVEWSEHYAGNEDRQRELLNSLENRPQQLRLLMAFYEEIRNPAGVLRSQLLKRSGVSAAVLQTQVKNGVMQIIEKEISRIDIQQQQDEVQHALSPVQQHTLTAVQQYHDEGKSVLLYGVTASGKTHIYIELILEALKEEKQVLYLLPEIALTAQLISRLNAVLGGVGVYHSRLSQAERTEMWYKVLRGELRIVVGARSALFLPFIRPGLIIIDEEHDPSYKQHEPAPRYHARDAALMLSGMTGAKVVLGSATPAVETFYLAQQGKYGLVKMDQPFYAGGSMNFCVEPVLKYKPKEGVAGAVITPPVREKMSLVLQQKKQIIVFQNRRGYAPFLLCATCGWIPFCKHCDVPLTYHKHINKLKCHYCGYMEPPPSRCAACASTGIIQRGIGTEKIEDELKLMFPAARIARLDQDAVRNKHGHAGITRMFEEHELDILVGTQMVAKGLDFSGVGLVVVPDVDSLLFYPDFRATERAFQLLYQVSGRTGRRNVAGEVCLQTARKQHPVLEWVMARDYFAFYREEIKARQEFIYPPFCRMAKFTFYHKDKHLSREAASLFAYAAEKVKNITVLGPAEPSVGKVKNLYLFEVLIKMPRSAAIREIKTFFLEAIDRIKLEQPFKQLRVVPDIDPA